MSQNIRELAEINEIGKDLVTLQREVAEVNIANGWHDGKRSFGDDIALLHSEVSEAFEAFRDHGLDDATQRPRGMSADVLPKPEGVGSELADVLIRLLDTCERTSTDLTFEYERKMAYNRTRGYRHGGKRI